MRTNLFPLIVVERGPVGRPRLGIDDTERAVHQIAEDRKVQIRLNDGSLSIYVTDPANEDSAYEVEIQAAYASVTSITEAEVVFSGVEVSGFRATGRALRIILTNAESGWL